MQIGRGFGHTSVQLFFSYVTLKKIEIVASNLFEYLFECFKKHYKKCFLDNQRNYRNKNILVFKLVSKLDVVSTFKNETIYN